MVTDDHDDDDPLKGVFGVCKSRPSWRRKSGNRNDICQREAQTTGTARPRLSLGTTSVRTSFPSASSLLPYDPQKSRHRNRTRLSNLPYLENLLLDDLTSDVISFEDGKLKQSKSIGKASVIKTPVIWSKNFITYVVEGIACDCDDMLFRDRREGEDLLTLDRSRPRGQSLSSSKSFMYIVELAPDRPSD
jgi:hypothetical protein